MCGAIDPEQARRAREPSQEGKNPEHPELAKSPTVPIIPSRENPSIPSRPGELLHLQGWDTAVVRDQHHPLPTYYSTLSTYGSTPRPISTPNDPWPELTGWLCSSQVRQAVSNRSVQSQFGAL